MRFWLAVLADIVSICGIYAEKLHFCSRRFHRNASIGRLGNRVTKIFRLSQGKAEIAEKRKYTNPENKQKQPAIGKEGISAGSEEDQEINCKDL